MPGRFDALASRVGRSTRWFALVLSLLLHALLYAPATKRPVDSIEDNATLIELELAENAAPEPGAVAGTSRSAAEHEPASTGEPKQRSTQTRRDVAPVRPDAPQVRPAPTPGPSEPAVVAQPAPATPPAVPQPPLRVDLSPRAAALTLRDTLDDDGDRGCRPRPEDASAAQCVAPDAGVAAAAERLQRALEDAATRFPGMEGRPPPELKRKLDGSYEYAGHVFRARIRPDGSVEFDDRVNDGTVGVGPVADGLQLSLTFDFDWTDAVEKHLLGKPLYPAEKRWFLEQTAAFRAELARADLARTLERGALRIRGRLIAIVDDPRRSAAAKRRAVFALWDDCADDEIGRQGQALVEAFIRERMPAHSELGYTPGDLDALNAERISPRRFDPYRAAIDGGAPG